METNKDYRVISDSRTAKAIIKAGYNHLLENIRPHRENKHRSVFIFKVTDELELFLEDHYKKLEQLYNIKIDER